MASKYDIVKLHIDTKGFSSKPTGSGEKGNTIGSIQYRTGRNIVTLTKEELVGKILSGYSFIPGVCPISEERKTGGARQKDWEGQQVFALDFDGGITMDEVLTRLDSLGVCPFFAYTTFSNSDEKKKFRVAFATSEVVVDRELRDRLQATLMGLFEGDVDKRCADRSRYFNGTKKDAETYINYEATIDAMEVVESYWNDEYKEFFPRDIVEACKPKNGSKTKSDSNKTKREKKSYEIESYGNVIPFECGYFRANAKADLVALDRVFSLRAWVEGDHRERFLFIYYNVAKLKYGSEQALKLVKEKNLLMGKALSDRELYYAITHIEGHIEKNMPYLHGDGVFSFNRETMASEEWLDLTEEEIVESGFLDTKRKNDRANANRPIKCAIKELVISLHNEGKTNKEIKSVLSEEGITLSLRTIQRYTENDKIPQTTLFNFIISPSNEENNTIVEEEFECNDEEACLVEEEALEATFDCVDVVAPTLNEEQQRAYEAIVSGNNTTILAKAGCGKTYVVSKAIESLREMNKCVGFCAATGVAAQALDGCTVHRMFGIYKNEENYSPNVFVANHLYDYDTIVVDEVGMLNASTFGKVVKAIQYMQANYNHNIQLVLVGDVLQLESVEGTYFFESPYFNQLDSTLLALNTNMRQSNGVFDRLVSNLREGVDVRNTIRNLNAICSFEEDRSAMYVYANKSRVYFKNNEMLSTIEGDLIRLDPYLSAKIGARVVVTENARNGKYYNGMMGVLKRVRSNSVVIETKDGREIVIRKQNMVVDEDESYEGYPLALGYAMTIHKVQGMTFDSLNIHPSCFACGQLYTALSRVRTSSGVHLLAPIKEKDVKVNQVALSFVRGCMGLDMAM